MIQTFIVAFIVVGAVVALLCSLRNTFKSESESPCGCGSSCAGCSTVKECSETTGQMKRPGEKRYNRIDKPI